MRIFGNNLFGSIDYQNKISIEDKINRLKEEIENADAIVIGAGAGLSTSAGFTYSGERFLKYFKDFADKYGIRDIYSGGFYPFKSKEEYWAWWSRHIYVNRYVDVPKPVYRNLLELVKDKDYFVLTTNVDHQFQRAGFDKKRMFYTQGDYGLWQCSDPCRQVTYDNEEQVKEMLLAQGFTFGDEGELLVPTNEAGEPDFSKVTMEIPAELVPYCPDCDEPLTMNLRADDSFVQDDGWYAANERYNEFMRRHENLHVLYLELGVGANTPVIIKYPFWQRTAENENAVYVCLNYGEAFCPESISKRSICIDGDIGDVLVALKK